MLLLWFLVPQCGQTHYGTSFALMFLPSVDANAELVLTAIAPDQSTSDFRVFVSAPNDPQGYAVQAIVNVGMVSPVSMVIQLLCVLFSVGDDCVASVCTVFSQ